MSPADLLAYLIGWNNQVLTRHQRRGEGLPDELHAPGTKCNEFGVLAQHYYTEHETDSWGQSRSQPHEAKNAFTELIHGYSDAEPYSQPWYGKWTIGRLILLNISSPYASARRRIRAWLRTL